MKESLKNGRVRSFPFSFRRSGGFSLFELVVFIICVAIIYATAANRFSQFPGAAERANFLAVITQVQAGVNLETLLGVSRGEAERMNNFEGANPMEMLLQPPSNYIGAFDIVDRDRLPNRSWYFDLSRKELVYLVNDSDNVYFVINSIQIPTDELRFKVEPSYRYEDRLTGRNISRSEISTDSAADIEQYRRRFNGVLMSPVTPYLWDAPAVELPEMSITESPG